MTKVYNPALTQNIIETFLHVKMVIFSKMRGKIYINYTQINGTKQKKLKNHGVNVTYEHAHLLY